MTERTSILLAHLSDVHLPLCAPFTLETFNAKRFFGWLNWHRNRRAVHTQAAADAIVADIKSKAPDHILISGDQINIGLPQEYVAALTWLNGVGSPDQVSIVPGNHDAYVEAQAVPGLARWSAFMRDDAFGRSLDVPRVSISGSNFPFVRRIGHVALIGVNSGVATPVGSAAGKVGSAQLAALAQLLELTGDAGLVRVIMIHHPPVPGLATGRRALADCGALAEILERHGAELVVHGHNHTMSSMTYAHSNILGVASASASMNHGDEPLARYNLIAIGADGEMTVETRGQTIADGPVVMIAKAQLAPLLHPLKL